MTSRGEGGAGRSREEQRGAERSREEQGGGGGSREQQDRQPTYLMHYHSARGEGRHLLVRNVIIPKRSNIQ